MAPDYLLDRATIGVIVTGLISLAGYKARALTRSGAAAGFVAGAIAVAAGWSWGLLLFGLFVSASILSRLGGAKKELLLEAIVEKDGERDAWQVGANGLVYVAAAGAFIAFGGIEWYAIGIGALAASTADTWSTEIGTLGGRVPRLIVSGKRVPPGTSGGITLAGTIGALAGSLAAGGAVVLAGWPVPFLAAVAGGLAGAFGDSLLGATVQSKRTCERCSAATERMIHGCGAATVHSRGISWLDNDGVNFVSTMIGGLVALLLSGIGSAG